MSELSETSTMPELLRELLGNHIKRLEDDKRRLMGFCMIAYSELEQVSPNYEFLALLEAELPKWTDEELAEARRKAKEISKLLNWTQKNE